MKSHKFLKRTVLFCIGFLVLYTVIQVLLSYKVGFELSSTLTTCVYAAFSAELGLCTLNRIFVIEDREEAKNKSVLRDKETQED